MAGTRHESRQRSTQDRLLPWLGGALSVLLVASLSAAVALPRHLPEVEPPPRAGALDLALDSPAVGSVPTEVVPTTGEQAGNPHAEPPRDDPAADDLPDTPPPAAAPPGEDPPPAPAPAPAIAQANPDPDTGREFQGHEPTTPAPAAPPGDPAPPAQEGATAQSEPTPDAGPGVSDSERIFAEEFPHHAAATQTDDPATRGWAVLVGVNRYQGRTKDTLGSVADALVMREVLLSHGWRDEHILVLTDGAATHDRIIRGIEWLMRTTDERSTVVFSFSGHMRHRDGVSALWPTDNRFIWAGDLGRMLGAVPAGRLWASLQGCHAEGLRAAGLEGAGRVVTYSSRVVEKSYEDPEVGHSVQGYFLFHEGFRAGYGDADGDGRVSIQEAYAWAAPRARVRTAERQSPVMADGVGEGFHLHLH